MDAANRARYTDSEWEINFARNVSFAKCLVSVEPLAMQLSQSLGRTYCLDRVSVLMQAADHKLSKAPEESRQNLNIHLLRGYRRRPAKRAFSAIIPAH